MMCVQRMSTQAPDPPSQLVTRPSVAPNLHLALLPQLFGAQTLGLLGHVFLLHLPALPDRRQAGGNFVVIQRLRAGAQAVGQALRRIRFVCYLLTER